MGRRLVSHVHVTHPETGEQQVFAADATPPAWAAALITNPAAWHGEDDPEPEPAPEPKARRAGTRRSRTKKEPADPGNSGAPALSEQAQDALDRRDDGDPEYTDEADDDTAGDEPDDGDDTGH